MNLATNIKVDFYHIIIYFASNLGYINIEKLHVMWDIEIKKKYVDKNAYQKCISKYMQEFHYLDLDSLNENPLRISFQNKLIFIFFEVYSE